MQIINPILIISLISVITSNSITSLPTSSLKTSSSVFRPLREEDEKIKLNDDNDFKPRETSSFEEDDDEPFQLDPLESLVVDYEEKVKDGYIEIIIDNNIYDYDLFLRVLNSMSIKEYKDIITQIYNFMVKELYPSNLPSSNPLSSNPPSSNPPSSNPPSSNPPSSNPRSRNKRNAIDDFCKYHNCGRDVRTYNGQVAKTWHLILRAACC